MSNPSPISLCCVPAPFVEQASGNVLTLNKPDDSTGITLGVSTWPFMALNQKTTLYACGQAIDGSPLMLRIADAEPLTQQEFEEGWRRTIAWDYLQSLKHNSHIVFVFQVSLGTACCDCPLLFSPLSLQVRVPVDDMTTFDNDDWNHWAAGPTMRPADLIVRNGILISDLAYKPAGVLLTKAFADLSVQATHEFSLSVRRRTRSRLSLSCHFTRGQSQ
ncbi:sugar-binding protein [Pseudomonas neuropathica]